LLLLLLLCKLTGDEGTQQFYHRRRNTAEEQTEITPEPQSLKYSSLVNKYINYLVNH